MGRPLQHEPDREEAQRARNNLQRAGVNVDERGKIEHSDEPKRSMKKAQWITKDNDEANNPAEQVHGQAQRTLSRIMRNVAQIEARRPDPGAGGTWTAPPNGTLMPNAHWRAAAQARTGRINIPQNTKCKLKANGGSPCETTLDPSGTQTAM